MGRFVNPDNSAFQVALNSEIYVDKTELITYTNKVLNTKQALICNSRPRRFGKSITADMLTAYYSKGCDSEDLFSGLAISEDASFQTHLNQYDVIHFDVQWCCMDAEGAAQTVAYINRHIISELKDLYPAYIPDDTQTAYGAMSCIHAATGGKFVVIIDEWDALIRDEEAGQTVQEDYINFLRGMFKGTEPTKFIQLAYLTGILPIKKLRTQSALNNFSQFTMLSPGALAPYFGFTEDEVKILCRKYEKDFDEVKRWYDGYQLGDFHVYNPNAVVCLMQEGSFQSYWSQTGTYETIVPLINRDFDGLKTAIIEMLSGAQTPVYVSGFQNDMVSFEDKDDVLTLLIHLGYLSYNQKKQTAFIPNEEIRQEFAAATRRKKWSALLDFQRESEYLLDATLDMDGEAVARGIEKIHMEYTSVIQYHDENSLSSVLTIAYLSTMQYYFKPIRELPTGRGFADFVFVPKTEYKGEYPALLVELKWNQNAMTALQQIKDRQYPSVLEAYTGDILLVGISYNRKTKAHECVIEKLQK
ncbi:MAG: ATP-binding protein [Lachnospiraceae bacterium]|nr:ATP-binding protein [Lachnospiraceae bacterium]